ncbi:hypothetical protein DEJ39_07190 [Bacteroidetes bacterium SCGC AAA795-G10]|nr:hypothetical protein DEJ39_07190 [Bacteroidetes bacterium SCGC AAA795-G10]
MKMKLIQRTNIESALKQNRESTYEEHKANLSNFIDSLSINTINNFDLNKLSKSRIYHIDHIKKVSIDYRLRFLDIKYFKNKLPIEALKQIKKLEKKHKTKLSEFKIMAPSVLFRLEKKDDPLLFVPLGNEYYYLIYKWGNDLHPFRKALMWPFKNIWNLLLAVLALSWVFTELTPLSLFTKNQNDSSYWMLLFFMFKAIASIVLYFGFALGKNFNPAIWDNRYNKA